MRKYLLLLAVGLVGWAVVARAQAEPLVLTWYISGEATTAAVADTLDDTWRSAATSNGGTTFSTATFTTGTTGDLVSTFDVGGTTVTATLHQLTDAQVSSALFDTGTLVTPASDGLTLGGTTTMQGGAPKPSSLSGTRHINDVATSTGGATSGRNAVLFDFGSPGLMAFGAWFGDLETNPAGRSAVVKVEQANGTITSQDVTPGASFGNSVTHWIGFVLAPNDSPITRLLVIVGDEDGGGSGQAEHLSFIGPTSANVPLAVTLDSFDATAEAGAVRLTWATSSEINNLGFNVRRALAPTELGDTLNASLIPSQGPGSSQGFAYEWLDRDGVPGTTYYYWLEDVDANGTVTAHGPISATPSAPTAVTLTTLTARPAAPLALILAGLLTGAWGVAHLARTRRRAS